MQIAAKIEQARLDVFAWHRSASIPLKVVLAVVMAASIGLLAQIRLSLPFTPVPVTGQTLAVLLVAIMVGRKWGGISVGIYGTLGLVGIPWLTGGVAGLGATTGYLAGFVLAALFVGYMTDSRKVRSFHGLLAVMAAASLLVYIPGILWLGGWLGLVLHKPAAIGPVLSMGAWPFIAGDILKATLAAGAAWLLLPKTHYAPRAETILPLRDR